MRNKIGKKYDKSGETYKYLVENFQDKSAPCKILGCLRGIAEVFDLLEYFAELVGGLFSTFQHTVSVPSSKVKMSKLFWSYLIIISRFILRPV
jgi:hypothetical protein